jgi:hypothetical protein
LIVGSLATLRTAFAESSAKAQSKSSSLSLCVKISMTLSLIIAVETNLCMMSNTAYVNFNGNDLDLLKQSGLTYQGAITQTLI